MLMVQHAPVNHHHCGSVGLGRPVPYLVDGAPEVLLWWRMAPTECSVILSSAAAWRWLTTPSNSNTNSDASIKVLHS